MIALNNKNKTTVAVIVLAGIAIAVGIGLAAYPLIIAKTTDTSQVSSSLRIAYFYDSSVEVGKVAWFYGNAGGGKEPYQYQWKFSDGIVLTNQNSTRTFGTPGRIYFNLTVTDAVGKHQEQTLFFDVVPAGSKGS